MVLWRFKCTASRVRRGKHQINPAAAAVIAILAASSLMPGDIITSTWNGGTGDWSDPALWTPSGLPQAGYQVLINNTTPVSVVTVDIDTPVLNNVGVASGGSLILGSDLSASELTSFGAITVGNGATLNAGNGGLVQDTGTAAFTVNSGGILMDSGTYSQGNGATLVNGRMSTTLLHVTGGTVTAGSGGVLSIGAGGYTQDGSVVTTINAQGKLTMTGDFSQGNGSTIVNGALATALMSVTGGSVTVGNGGVLQTTGTSGYAQGVAGTTTTIEAGGLIQNLTGNYSQELGTSTVLNGTISAATVKNSGTLSGDGEIEGALNNLGTLDPDEDGNGPMHVTGDYLQSGFLLEDLNGPGAPSDLSVGGQASLGGTLDVSFANGVDPFPGETFDIMSYASLTGTFNNLIAPDLPSADIWVLNYGPALLTLSIETAPAEAPEPSVLLLMVGGIGAILLAGRRSGSRS